MYCLSECVEMNCLQDLGQLLQPLLHLVNCAKLVDIKFLNIAWLLLMGLHKQSGGLHSSCGCHMFDIIQLLFALHKAIATLQI